MANPLSLRTCPICHKTVMPEGEPRTGGAEVPKPRSTSEKPRCPECGNIFKGKKYDYTS